MSLIHVEIDGWVLVNDKSGSTRRGFKCSLTKGTNKICIAYAPRKEKG